MANSVAQELARCHRGLVVAPAGCGKTYLIAESVSYCRGRQLILTHTHAGVRAILDHMRRHSIPPSRFRVSTIDGFALRYASAFSSLSGWTEQQPVGEMWNELRPAAAKTFATSAVQHVLDCSYKGIFVDEYQDCSVGQHELIMTLSEILPVRILGDPLQSVFWKVNKNQNVIWKDVELHFPKIGELSVPHRWGNTNPTLGEWLLEIRKQLIAGQAVDLTAGPAKWQRAVDQPTQISACYGATSDRRHSVLGIHAWGRQCHSLARRLNNFYRAMETVECEDLHDWSQKLEASSSLERVQHVFGFLRDCLARLPSALNNWEERFAAGKCPGARREDYKHLIECLCVVRDDTALCHVAKVLDAVEALNEPLVYGRLELWREMKKTLAAHALNSDRNLSESAWHIRNKARHIGRRVDRRCLATTLLAKGLEFDHAVVFNIADLEDAENVYVAMTRGARSLTILSETSTIQRGIPHYLLGRSSRT